MTDVPIDVLAASAAAAVLASGGLVSGSGSGCFCCDWSGHDSRTTVRALSPW